MPSLSFPKWQVHRGYWKAGVRENTLQAFVTAKRLGAQMVEMDVQLCKESIPVVFHDFTLKRLFHIDEKIKKTKLEDLKALNIPMLSQVLKNDEVPEYLNIELKEKGIFCLKLVRAVLRDLKKVTKKKVLISSFNPICLFWLGIWSPKIPRALIISDPKIVLGWRWKLYLWLAVPHFLNVHFELIDNSKSRDRIIAWKRGVMVWTVNDWEKAQFYLGRGASSIISDELPKANL